MAFLRTIADILAYGHGSVSVPLFLLSVLLLATGLALQAWADTLKFRFLERRPLSWIEQTHPYLPSLRVILAFDVCILVLLGIGLQTMPGVFPFNDPYQGLNLVSLFLLAAALGTIGELRWRGADVYASAFILGTALAFLARTILAAAHPLPMIERVILACCALAVALLAARRLTPARRGMRALFVAGLVFFFWIFVFTQP
jgi:hypothetical protein